MRTSNFELLRIVCMLFIVLGHIIMCHRVSYDLSSIDYIVDFIARSFCMVAVNAFVLISGYWGIKFKIQRLLRLNSQTWFYSVFIFSITILLGWHKFNLIKDIGVFMPVFAKQYWFITAYFALYLLSPILNRFVLFLSQHHYKYILVLGFFLFYIWPTASFLINTGQLVDDAGYGIVNFVYLYLLGRYIHLYNVGERNKAVYLLGYVVCSILCIILQLLLSRLLGFEFTSWWSYNTLFIFGGAVCLFLYFSRLKIQSKIINKLATYSLSVYLIHMEPHFWRDFCEVLKLKEYAGVEYIVLLVLFPIVIYLLCSLMEYIRMLIFGKIEDFIILRVCKNRIFLRIQNIMDSLNFK